MSNCRIKYEISKAGHLLRTKSSSQGGSILATKAKAEKRKRLSRGCVDGLGEVFSLTPKQKRNLPKALQKAILNHHRKLGKKIID